MNLSLICLYAYFTILITLDQVLGSDAHCGLDFAVLDCKSWNMCDAEVFMFIPHHQLAQPIRLWSLPSVKAHQQPSGSGNIFFRSSGDGNLHSHLRFLVLSPEQRLVYPNPYFAWLLCLVFVIQPQTVTSSTKRACDYPARLAESSTKHTPSTASNITSVLCIYLRPCPCKIHRLLYSKKHNPAHALSCMLCYLSVWRALFWLS